MKFKLFLIPVLFLLAMSITFALTDDEVNDLVDRCDLIAYMDINGTVDNSSNENEATTQVGVTHQTSGCVVEGCNEYFDTSDYTVFPFISAYGHKDYDACAWIKTDTALVANIITTRKTDAAGEFEMGTSSSSQLKWGLRGGQGGANPVVNSIFTDTWNFVCGKMNGTAPTPKGYLYVNITEVGSFTVSGAMVSIFNDLWIGASEQFPGEGWKGRIDEVIMCRNMTDNEREHIWDENRAGRHLLAIPITGQTAFTVTAKDIYDNTALTNISIRVFNSSFSVNTSTVNGTIILLNISFKFKEFYNIEFSSNDTGGYFNNSVLNVNITEEGSLQGTLFQSVLRLIALDGLTNETISSFTAETNLSSNSTTTGQIFILIKNGTFQLNITAAGFDKLITNFTIGTLENNSLNVTMGSIFNFQLIREETDTPFDFNATNGTTLNIFCPNQTIVLTFNISNNISQIINCQFTLMQVVVDYGILGSYFRTLIPPFSQKNISWYLIDLVNGDTAIQRIIKLLDLTGEFADSTLTVERSIGNSIEKMIEQKFDISSQVNLFLVKDALYSISIENSNEDIVLGNLIPTEAGEQTITLPKIDFVPQETILGDNVSWSYTFNITSNILRMQYNDKTNRTTLVRFTVFNDTTNGLQQLFTAQSENNASVTITFNQAFANTTYITELFVKHTDFTNFTEKKMFYQFKGSGAIDLLGWTPTEQTSIKKWIAWIFLAVLGMLFSRRYMGIGMIVVIIFLWIFRKWNWIEVPDLIFGFVALMAVVGWIVDAMRKN